MSNGVHGHEAHAQWCRSLPRCVVFCQPRQEEVSMLALKHIGAATIAAVIATAMVIDSADARRGGGGARASGGGARVANTGAFARAWHPTTGRLGFGRPGWSAAALGAVAVGTGLAYAGSNY